ncbi:MULTISPECIES: serine hydrolase [unclassified Lactobacillus]|uniref:serine hydrolase n=1 Tax=unclassified Lactobacillus TaxID=2620435 RepID=UPI000EFD4255|nr:D-alanyl-D-alanine carboxypeptidase [Lactobacillus sp. ESL0247]RMC28404.1 D-alanyl-D-alanine carboxypeptidase [Lactobacillus sp. ESL0246]RMC31229.1 D-alanyl-D-alanine carboxypeptidase [Lactobacillus sp. ESL0245]
MSLKHKIKNITLVLVAIIGLLLPIRTVSAQEVPTNYHHDQLDLKAKSAIAIDSKSGQILYGKNVNQSLPIASMTKLVTVYLTLKAIDEGKIKWDTTLQPTRQIVAVSTNRDFSNVPLRMGHSYNIQQLYQATLIESANGAAMMLAQAVSGSQLAFVKQMRMQLQKWGINDAKIYTTCGLPNKSVGTDAYPNVTGNAENMMSAKDMAVVGQHLVNDFPEIIKTTKIPRLDFIDQNFKTPMTNFNWMLKGLPQYHSQLKIDGLKTGTTDAAGACFIATAKHAGARLITVVMGARHLNGTDPARFEQTDILLRYLYHNYHPVVFHQNEVIMGETTIKVNAGQKKQVGIGMKQNSVIWVPTNQQLKARLTNETVDAPVKVGQIVSSYNFTAGGSKLISLNNPDGIKLPVRALQSTTKVNIFVRFWRWLFGG